MLNRRAILRIEDAVRDGDFSTEDFLIEHGGYSASLSTVTITYPAVALHIVQVC